MEESCYHCEGSSGERRLSKCAICHRWFCEEHAQQVSGREFCSKSCGEYFFFGDPEEIE
jgi:hypothetical protein